ncbi:P-loop containing nucleoside triphosphate hydrolase protein, partial [Aureobasidium melanogenum]
MQANDIPFQIEEEPFEVLEKRYREMEVAWKFTKDIGKLSSGENEIFQMVRDQYRAAKSKQSDSNQTESEGGLDLEEQGRTSDHLFVQEDESNHEEEYASAAASTGSKRKRGELSTKQAIQLLIDEAPMDKKQAAHKDGAILLQAVTRFPAGTVKYIGNDLWSLRGMATPLKHHQLISTAWIKNQENNAKGPKGGILADDMGMGKTICAIASMSHNPTSDSRTSLVVVPKIVKDQWINEIRKHTDRSSPQNFGFARIHAYSTTTSVKTQLGDFKEADIVIATYGELCAGFKIPSYPKKLKSDAQKARWFEENVRAKLGALHQYKFHAVYLVEGHDIRNIKALRTMACLKLQVKFRWILTGTPMTNTLEDLYSGLVFIEHHIVSKLTFGEFKAYCKDSDKNSKKGKDAKNGRGNKGKKNKNQKKDKDQIDIDWISNLLKESMSRWTHSDEILGRPLVVIPKPIFIELRKEYSAPERIIYSVLNERLDALAKQKMASCDDTKTYKFVKGLLMALRQMTGHVLLINPAIFRQLTDEDVSAIEYRIREADAENPDAYAEDYIAAVRKLQRKQNLSSPPCLVCHRPIGEMVDAAKDAGNEKSRWSNENGKVIPSTKSSAVVDCIKTWSAAEDPQAKIVIFTSFRNSHKFLADTFKEQQWEFATLTSEMSSAERQASVDRFTDEPTTFIMLAMAGVGGQGVNLTAATKLINYDHYFNESSERQACCRIFRIGQTKQTTMVFLTITETVDEHVRDIKRRKARRINIIMAETKRKTTKALLKLFEKAKKSENDTVEEDEEIELDDDE